ncbi:hypothetical protein G5I_08010 [Acromyrmex echinatior]|uniref:Uncharacterized protein n=1 Tax=Acromyrmex echinatior TaxID=103372 RepID=F4WQC1_ACREC|nr:hypothetical protein G5I_08010 [Acromyrmex echinatior]
MRNSVTGAAGRLACTWRDIGRIVAALRRRSSKHEDAAIYRTEEAGRDVKDGQQYCGMHIPRAFGTPYTSTAWYYVISQINERKAVRNGQEIHLENMPLESREPGTDRRA